MREKEKATNNLNSDAYSDYDCFYYLGCTAL